MIGVVHRNIWYSGSLSCGNEQYYEKKSLVFHKNEVLEQLKMDKGLLNLQRARSYWVKYVF